MLNMETPIRPALRRTHRLNPHVRERSLQIMLRSAKVTQIVAMPGEFAVPPDPEVGDEIAVPTAADGRDEGRGGDFGLDHPQGELGAFTPCFFPFGAQVDGAGGEVVGEEGVWGSGFDIGE
jgi:hypothetical protein